MSISGAAAAAAVAATATPTVVSAAAAAAAATAAIAAAIAAATAATATDVLTQLMPPSCCYHIQQKTLLTEPLRLYINTFNINNCSSSLWL